MAGRPVTDQLQAALTEALAGFRAENYWVGFSGGLDSTALLSALHVWARNRSNIKLGAVHVNHQLQSQADDFVRHCQEVTERLGIPLLVRSVEVEKTKAGLEADARTARYQAFTELLNQDDLLLLAHHRQDQAETLLLRLLRGASVSGLAGIPESRKLARGWLIRPFLNLPRPLLADFVSSQKLPWIEDPENASLTLERGRLRQILLPLLAEHWPNYEAHVSQLAPRIKQAQQILIESAAEDLARVKTRRDQAAPTSAPKRIQKPAYAQLSSPRRLNLLRHWLSLHAIWDLTEAGYQELDRQITSAKRVHFRCSQGHLRSFQDECWLLQGEAPVGAPVQQAWQPEQQGSLKTAHGSLYAESAIGEGLSADMGCFTVRTRQPADRIMLNQVNRPLKKVFQELAVPPWVRPLLPLLFVGERLVAIADLCVADHARTSPDGKGWRLSWSGENDHACL